MRKSYAMCPQCGRLFKRHRLCRLIPDHEGEQGKCYGSGQNPRNSLSDARLLWNGQPNPHIQEVAQL